MLTPEMCGLFVCFFCFMHGFLVFAEFSFSACVFFLRRILLGHDSLLR